jgi:hypothetical protein
VATWIPKWFISDVRLYRPNSAGICPKLLKSPVSAYSWLTVLLKPCIAFANVGTKPIALPQ